MATSGTYTLALTANDIFDEAFDMLGQGVDGETLSGNQFKRAKNSANLMLKEWQTQGIHLWSYTEGTLFLKVGQEKYNFRDSTTHAANAFFETTTTAATTASALSFAVTSSDDIQKEDLIGIIQNDDDLFFTTVRRVSGLTVFIDDGITLATLSGARVYNYRPSTSTSLALTPISRVLDVRRREGTDYEIPIIFESREDYFNLPNKAQKGTPIQAYYERSDVAGQVGGVMYLWSPPSSSLPVINFTYERKLQIITASTETLDIPDFAQYAFTANLAEKLMMKYGGVSPQKAIEIKEKAQSSLADMLSYDQAVYPITLDMGMNR